MSDPEKRYSYKEILETFFPNLTESQKDLLQRAKWEDTLCVFGIHEYDDCRDLCIRGYLERIFSYEHMMEDSSCYRITEAGKKKLEEINGL